MRRAAKVDDNHGLVVDALRAAGWSVVSLAPMGKGVLDLLVAKLRFTMLLEVKDGTKPPSARKLTEAEQKFIDGWRGDCAVVTSPEEAVREAERALADKTWPRAKVLPWPSWTADQWRAMSGLLLGRFIKDERYADWIRPFDVGTHVKMAEECNAMAAALERP